MDVTSACVQAMDDLAAVLRPSPPPEEAAARLQDHAASCARCRAACTDALACAPWLRSEPSAAGPGPVDPVAWERSLFLRLLSAEREAADARRPAGRSPAWARLAIWLGPVEPKPQEGEWSRWKRGPWPGASPR